MSAPSRVLGAARALRTGGLLFQYASNVYDYVSIPHDPNQNVTGDFTLVLWVFLKHPLQPASFIHKGTWPAIINYFFANQTYTTNHYFVFSDTNSYLIGSGSIPLNRWSRWICIKRGSFMGVYRDGSLIQGRDDISGNPQPSTEPIELGKYGASYASCMIDKVRLYNRALSEEERDSIFSRDAVIREGLILCLEFTEGEGTRVQDLGPHRYMGTIYGRASWAVKRASRTLQL